MKKIFLTIALVAGMMVSAQVKIGDNVTTLNANSLLELESTNKGVLFPRVTLTGTTDATTVGTQVPGMTVYNTAATSDVTVGMYTSNGTKWVKLGSSTGVESFTAPGTIAETTYLLNYSGAAGTLTTPTPIAGKSFWVRNSGIAAITVAGVGVNGGKSRCFISDGTSWFLMTP